MTLRKRNKLIVAFALGVLIGQSATDGGAMNAFRAAVEQHKPVATFTEDSTKDTSGNLAITESRLTQTFTFASERPDPQVWRTWLSKLSSSI